MAILKRSLHFFSRWNQSKMILKGRKLNMSEIAERRSRAPSVKNTRDPGLQSIPFDRRNASTIVIICETVAVFNVYVFDSLFWMCATVLFTISLFSLAGEPFFLPSAFCFLQQTSSIEIFALIALWSSNVSFSL